MPPSVAPPEPPSTSPGSGLPEPTSSSLPRMAMIGLPVLALVALAIIDLDALRTIATATLGSPQAILIVIGLIAALVGISGLAARAGVRGWAHTAVVLIPLAAISAWAIAPYFMDGEELVEELPALASAAAPPEGDRSPADRPDQAAAGPTAGTTADAEGSGAADTPDDGAVEVPEAEGLPSEEEEGAAADDSATAPAGSAMPAEPAPSAEAEAPAGPVELSRGSFVGLDNHRAAGDVAAIDLGDGSQVVQLQDIDLQRVPDAHVYVVPTSGATSPTDGAVHLEPLKAEMGTHHYELPADVDLSAGDWTLLVWCEAFASPVGGATLN